jgi:MFS family permease
LIKLYSKFFGIDSLNLDAQKFIFKSFNTITVFIFFIMFTDTFFILYSLQFVTLAELGYLTAVRFFVQAVTDYPTGAIGDWIGQRWVLATASLFFAIGFLVLSQATTFNTLLIAFIFLALASGQQSGAFFSWFDNNYKHYSLDEDKDRRIYSQLFGKFIMIFQITSAVAFIFGGIIVQLFGRSEVFFVQGVLFILLIFILLTYIIDHPNLIRSKPEFNAYFNLLGEGLTSTWNNRTLRLLVIGFIISGSVMTIWGTFILFPLYESYSKTDDLTAILRSIIFIIGAVITGLMGLLSKKIYNTQKWLALIVFISNIFFFWGMFFMLNINPAPNEFSIFPFIIVILAFTLLTSPMSLRGVLFQRFLLDVIPDKNRNSVYSLIPTLVVFASIITTALGGQIITELGEKSVLIGLGLIALVGSSISAWAVLKHKTLEPKERPKELEPILPFINVRMIDVQEFIPMTVPSAWTFSSTAQQIWNDLITVALSDSGISLEEQILLEKIMTDVKAYAKVLEDALEDGIIDDDEQKQLMKTRKRIWTEAHKTAMEIDSISDDEQNILMKLAEILHKLENEDQVN